MQAEISPYVSRASWIHGLDPRVKFLAVLVGLLLVFLWSNLLAPLVVAAGCLALAALARVPLSHTWRTVRAMLPLLVLVFVLTALFGGPDQEPLAILGPLRVTTVSIRLGALLALRLFALALVFDLWLATTDQAALVRGLVAIRVPYSWGLTLALSLRYLPIFANLFQQVREAQQARGLQLEGRGLWQRLRAYNPILIAMIISSLRHSERLGWALEARGLGASGITRSVYRPLRLRRPDKLAIAVLLSILVAAVALRLY